MVKNNQEEKRREGGNKEQEHDLRMQKKTRLDIIYGNIIITNSCDCQSLSSSNQNKGMQRHLCTGEQCFPYIHIHDTAEERESAISDTLHCNFIVVYLFIF